MEYVAKAILDTVQGANANREDLSNTISMVDGPARPVSQGLAQTTATNTTHQWNEQGLNTAGRTNVAGGGATYAEGSLPPSNAKAMSRKTNKTCRVGRLAQVSDDEMAAFNGGGAVNLADGEMERLIQNALDFETGLVTVEVLNQIEFMHVSGDSSNATMEGGETDGLYTWINAGGVVFTADGGSSTTPVAFAESFIKDAARAIALNRTTYAPDTMLVPAELIPDVNSFIAAGAGRPIVQIASGDNDGLVAGQSVNKYNTGFSVVDVKNEPYLSSAYNSTLTGNHVILYNKAQVRQANLIAFGAAPLARTDTSVKRLVNCVFAQEHRVAKAAAIIPFVKSAIT